LLAAVVDGHVRHHAGGCQLSDGGSAKQAADNESLVRLHHPLAVALAFAVEVFRFQVLVGLRQAIRGRRLHGDAVIGEGLPHAVGRHSKAKEAVMDGHQ